MRPDGSEITRLTTDAVDEYGVAGDIAWQPLPSDGGTSTSPSPTATSSPVDTGPAEPHASARIQIDADGRQISDMAAGQGALWATLTEDSGTAPSSLVTVNPVSNQIVAEIPLDGCTGELTAGAGAVWMLGVAANDRAVLCRIDPATDRVAATILLPDGTLGPMVASDEAVWIAHLVVPEGREFKDASRSILRVDPGTNEIVATIPAEVCTLTDADCTPTWGSAGEGAVWFEGYRLGETVKVDPSTDVATTIPSGACGMAAGEGWAWVGVRAADGPTDVWNVAELVVRIDPTTGQTLGEPIPLRGGRWGRGGHGGSGGCGGRRGPR